MHFIWVNRLMAHFTLELGRDILVILKKRILLWRLGPSISSIVYTKQLVLLKRLLDLVLRLRFLVIIDEPLDFILNSLLNNLSVI